MREFQILSYESLLLNPNSDEDSHSSKDSYNSKDSHELMLPDNNDNKGKPLEIDDFDNTIDPNNLVNNEIDESPRLKIIDNKILYQ